MLKWKEIGEKPEERMMANMKNNSASQETRRRLLLAAGEVFAEQGYHAAKIQEITSRAKASLASVNYHFGDKAELYLAVLRQIGEKTADPSWGRPMDPEADAATRIRACIHVLCQRMVSQDSAPWETLLLFREITQPTSGASGLMEAHFLPMYSQLCAAVAELLGAVPGDEVVGLVAVDILGPCFYYMIHAHCLGRLHPQLGDHPNTERIASHLAEFALAGIEGIRKQTPS
jgi:AcrR family transcriptional regulator